MFIIFEFLEPALSAGVYSAGFILGMELVGPERRVLGAFFINVFYALGEALLGLLAMLTRDWRLLMRVAYVPTFIFLIYRWLIPESARWLLNMNRTRDAAKIIDSAAKMNKSPLTPEARKMLDNVLNAEPVVEEKDGKLREKEPEAKEYNLLLAFKSKTLVLRMINCSYCWIAVCFVFYGMSMNSVSVAGDKYVNFIMNCLIEIPGAGLCCLLMDRIGRRMMLCISLILSGAACIGFIFLTGDVPEAVHITVFLIGKFNISMSFITIYVYTAELFPTELRHSLLAACSMFGRLGSIVAPFTPLLGKYVEPLPMILFATMAISSGIFIMFAPETLNKTLPDTLKEAEDIGNVKMSVKEEKTFDLDLLIHQIGPFGKFQLINYLLICIPIAYTAMYTLIFVFTAGNLEYRCRISGCDSDNSSLHAPFLNFTIPKDGDKFSMCQKFHNVPNATIEDQCQADLFDRTRLEDCSEFVYQDDETTILSEWDLGCNEEWKLSLVGTIKNIGHSGVFNAGFILDAPEGAQLAVFLISKSAVTMSYITMYVYTTELFPTELRQTLLSACVIFGRIGSIVAPFTVLLGKYFESLEMILFAAVAIPGGTLILLAPETLKTTLPDTVQEAEDIGKP
uniref:Major facilitator superfamily (MFS) profile domain-containing protein n=1 Tax=Phlebotomus papatasi TaxID=29031 RepID=A0A1B0DGX8_PHLPP